MERVELLLIDELYAGFVAALPGDLVDPALSLAVTLGLAPTRDVPWSDVFSHEVTLGAPLLLAEAMPALPAAVVRDATLAHLLAIIEAFGTDRIEDGQAPRTPALEAVLMQTRRVRDAALARVVGDGDACAPAYEEAERETLAAIHAERRVLCAAGAVDFDRYLAISHGKQRVGLPASLALARAAGWDARRTRCLGHLLDDVWVGLQLHDDVVDWEDDLVRGGAWASSLAAPDPCSAGERDTGLASTRDRVHRSGVLVRMLRASTRRFRAAGRRAGVLGAQRLVGWAREREAITLELAQREAEAPGFTLRARSLSAWARIVLG